MERTTRAAVDPPPTSAGRMSAPGKRSGNCPSATPRAIPIRGRGVVMNASTFMSRSDEHLAAVVGVDDVIVVTTKDAVLVAQRGAWRQMSSSWSTA